MKLMILMTLLFMACTAHSEDDFFTHKNAYIQPPQFGCKIGGKFFSVGTRKQMNHKELALYKERTGYRASDGYAVMMQCLYVVDPLQSDHPRPDKRVFVWVAS